MTWFKVDDSFYDHPKVFDLPDSAVALWIRAGCWSARNLTDGFVPARMPARLCDDPDTAVKALVDSGLWRRSKGGYQFHDWADYQPTREEVERGRKAAAERQRRRRARMRQQINEEPVTDMSRRDSRVNHNGSHGGSSRPPTRPDPTRPDPTRPSSGSVDRHLPPVDAREDDDDQDLDRLNEHIEGRIVELLRETTGRTVDRGHAAKVRRLILDGRDTRNPLGYVTSAIRGEPTRFLPPADPHGEAGAQVIAAVRTADWDTAAQIAHKRAAEIRARLARRKPNP